MVPVTVLINTTQQQCMWTFVVMSSTGIMYTLITIAVLGPPLLGVFGQQFGQHDIEKMYEMCKKESNATDDELSAFQKSQSIPTTPHGKCLLACIFQNTGVMTQEGKYNVEGLNNLASQSYSKVPDKLSKAKKVVDVCAEDVKKSEDKCEVAVLIANCTMVTSVKLGLDS